MEKLHKLRELIESKIEYYNEGEYLEAMNLLKDLSKTVDSLECTEEKNFACPQ